MRKIRKPFSIFLILLLVLSFTACGGPKENEEAEPMTDDGYTAEDFLAMQPVFNTIGIYYGNNMGEYSCTDSKSMWKLLFIMTNVMGPGMEGIVMTGEGYEVPAATLEKCGRALFCEYKELPPLPEGSTIKHIKETDIYLIPIDNSFLADTDFTISRDEGMYTIHATTYDKNTEPPSELFTFSVDLRPNPDAKGSSIALFPFSVKEITP